MSAVLSPIVSEFDTEEQASRYAAWLTAKIQASLQDPRPGVPHDQVEAEMDAIIAEAESQQRLRSQT
jgi:hypothetical protein